MSSVYLKCTQLKTYGECMPLQMSFLAWDQGWARWVSVVTWTQYKAEFSFLLSFLLLSFPLLASPFFSSCLLSSCLPSPPLPFLFLSFLPSVFAFLVFLAFLSLPVSFLSLSTQQRTHLNVKKIVMNRYC